MIKRKHNIPYSKNTILKVMREIDFLPPEEKKTSEKAGFKGNKG